jgi:hypothetical protein
MSPCYRGGTICSQLLPWQPIEQTPFLFLLDFKLLLCMTLLDLSLNSTWKVLIDSLIIHALFIIQYLSYLDLPLDPHG